MEKKIKLVVSFIAILCLLVGFVGGEFMSGVAKKSLGTPADQVKATNVVVTDSEDAAVTRSGTWTVVQHPSATDLTYIYSTTSGDYLEFKFKGTGLWLRFFGLPDGGKANVSIDGGTAKVLDTYTATERLRIGFVASNLTLAEHTVKVEVTASKNVLSTNYKIGVDAFIVELSRGAMQIWAMIEESLVAESVPAPVKSSQAQGEAVVVPAGEDYYHVTINGTGIVLFIMWHINSNNVADIIPLIKIDGVPSFPIAPNGGQVLGALYDWYIGDSKEGLFFGKYDTTNHQYALILTLPLEFKTKLEVGARNEHISSGIAVSVYVEVTLKG